MGCLLLMVLLPVGMLLGYSICSFHIIEKERKKLTSSEALYGFIGWLTTRDKEMIASAKHDAGIWAKVIETFCKENNLKEPRDGWENNLVHPSSECSGGSKNV